MALHCIATHHAQGKQQRDDAARKIAPGRRGRVVFFVTYFDCLRQSQLSTQP